MIVMMIIPAGSVLDAQNEYDILGENWLQYTDAPNSLYHYIAGQAYEMLAKRSGDISTISTLEEWQARQKMLQETLLDIVGPFPSKTPLNPKIIRTSSNDVDNAQTPCAVKRHDRPLHTGPGPPAQEVP